MSAASHGTTATEHIHFYSPPSPSQTTIFTMSYHFWHRHVTKKAEVHF